jgi:hypothetical protein
VTILSFPLLRSDEIGDFCDVRLRLRGWDRTVDIALQQRTEVGRWALRKAIEDYQRQPATASAPIAGRRRGYNEIDCTDLP